MLEAIKKLFEKTPRFPELENDNWHSAGILFTAQNTILAGYKIVNDNWQVSGFGGKRHNNEKYYQTAIREVLEELYEIPITHQVVEFVASRLKISKVVNNGGYILIICKLKQIHKFMIALLHYSLDTPMYKELPISITELIGNRSDKSFSEFHYLTFVSTKMLQSKTSPNEFDPNLVSDMKYI